jgi:putative ABC transport system permease protein
MTFAGTMRMATRQAWQGWRNGEFGVLLAALFVAVLALAGVGSIAQRTTDALAEQSRRLVGGDAAFSSDDRAIDAAQRDAQRLHLRMFRSVELASMVGSHDAAPQLGTLKALADDAPLLGPYTVRTAQGVQRLPRPAAGTLWLSDTGAQRMRSKLGGMVAQRRGARAAGDPAAFGSRSRRTARPRRARDLAGGGDRRTRRHRAMGQGA